MRVVINQKKIKRNRQLSHILFLVSLAGMGIGFFYTWTADPNAQTSQISCFILPMLMLLTLISVRMANTWIREPRPEDVLEQSFKGLGKKYTIFHYLLPAPHVLIGPEGVFTVTTVWQEGQYAVKGKKWSGDSGLVRKILGYMRQDLLGNPFSDAMLEAQQVQRLLDKIAPDAGVEVQPLVVFTSPKVEVEIEDPMLPVLYADPKRRPSLREYLKSQANSGRKTLRTVDLDKLDELYGLVTRREIAEMLGEPLPTGEADTSQADTSFSDKSGTVFVAQAGQLYHIGATHGPLDEALDALRDMVEADLFIVHHFTARDPHAKAQQLRRKFERKQQRPHWFGLSKKDVTWLKGHKDEK